MDIERRIFGDNGGYVGEGKGKRVAESWDFQPLGGY